MWLIYHMVDSLYIPSNNKNKVIGRTRLPNRVTAVKTVRIPAKVADMSSALLTLQKEIDTIKNGANNSRLSFPAKLRSQVKETRSMDPLHKLTSSKTVAAHAISLSIPKTTQHMIANQIDPFDPNFYHAQSTYENANTQTVPVKTAFTAYAGTLGVCQVSISPNNLGREAVRLSSATSSVGNQILAPSGSSNFNYGVLSKPYDNAMSAVSNGETIMKSRLVSAGIRIRHTGASDARSGVVKVVTSQDNRDLFSNDLTALEVYGQVRSEPVTNGWTTAVWRPKTESQKRLLANDDLVAYSHAGVPGFPSCTSTTLRLDGPTNTVINGGTALVISVQGVTPGQSFAVEIIEHWEYSGMTVGLLGKPVIADISGNQKADAIMHIVENNHTGDPSKDKIVHTAEAVEQIAFALEPVAAAGATAIFGPAGGEAVHVATNVVKQIQKPLNDIIGSLGSSFMHLF